MAEEKSKKPKIDLKARLGKTTATGGAPTPGLPAPPGAPTSSPDGRVSAPPPMGIAPPVGIAPPPGIGGGPLSSPFAPKPQPKAAPVSAEAQTIKVEVSEEIHVERKRSGRRAAIYALIAAIAGGALGFFAGGNRERHVQDQKAVSGLKGLGAEVQDATKRAEEIGPILDEIEKGLASGKFPDASIDKLTATIPFNASNLDGKYFGSMPNELQKATLAFLKSAENVNDKREALKNTLQNAKKQVETAWAEADKPVFKLGVSFRQQGQNTMAEMIQLKEPWEVSKPEWPAEPKIIVSAIRDRKRVQEEKTAKRWVKDALTGETPIVIPVEPASVAGFTDEKLILRLQGAIFDVRVLLKGDETPGREVMGLIREGEALTKVIDKNMAKAAK